MFLRRGDTWANSELNLSARGSMTDPITLSAYGTGPNPIITGADLTTASCIILQNPTYVNVDSMDCRDAKVGIYLRYTGGNLNGTGDMFNNQSVNISCCNFQNMDEVWSDGSGDIEVLPPFELSWGAGVWVGGSIPTGPGGPWPSESSLILNGLSITHCSFQNTSTGVGNGWYFPPVFKSRLTNLVLEDLWVTGCENGSFALFFVDGGRAHRVDTYIGGTGFYRTGTTGGFIQDALNFDIDDCEFAGNLRNFTGNDGCGMDFEGGCENMTLTNTVMHSNDGCALLILDSPSPNDNVNLIMNANTFYNNCRNPVPSSGGQNNELRYPNSGSTGQLTNLGVYLGTDVGSGGLDVFDRPSNFSSDFNPTDIRSGINYATVSARPTEWSFAGSVEGWGSENQWTGFSASGGALVGTSAGVDPYAESADTFVNTRANRWVRVVMSQTAGSTAQIFFQTETTPTFTADKSIFFPIIADGVLREYIVDMNSVANYKGVITKWRLDPTDAGGSSMVIDSFEARPNPIIANVTPISDTEIDVQFNMPMLPQGGVMTASNYSISGGRPGNRDISTRSYYTTLYCERSSLSHGLE